MEEKLNFEKGKGLIPAVIQDCETKEVLMVGYMNSEAVQLTLETGYVWFYSRKRKKMWKKGEQSGNLQNVKRIFLDCDNDTLLIEVSQIGGACDLGFKSCFNKILIDGEFVEFGEKVFNPQEVYPYSENISLCLPTGSLSYMTDILIENIKSKGFKEMGTKSRNKYVLEGYSGEICLYRSDPRKIPYLVEKGEFDCAITGKDCILETGTNITMLGDLKYNKLGKGIVSWVLAVRSSLDCNNLSDLEGRKVTTAIPNIANKLFKSRGINTIICPNEEFKGNDNIDAIIEIAESGKTISDRGFRIVSKVLSTSACFIGCNSSWGYTWKRKRIEKLYSLLHEATDTLPVNSKEMLNPISAWPLSEDNFI